MTVIFTRLAKQELDDATAYYEMQIQGLGKRFRTEVTKAVNRISEYPEAWSVEAGEIRRCMLPVFPYKLLYSVEKNFILIIAVAHLHRKPDYWVDRM